jgi:VanZ family protein
MISIKKFIPGIAWFFFVLILLCLPGSDIPKVDNIFDKIFFDKWVHAGLFCVLAFLWMMPVGKADVNASIKFRYFIKVAVAVIIWGITTEYIQKYFVKSRGFELLDWAADCVGILTAFFYCKKKYLSKK